MDFTHVPMVVHKAEKALDKPLYWAGLHPIDWPKDQEYIEVEGDVELFPGLTLLETPGHTPGHCIGLLESKGSRAVFSGDAMHSPIQAYEPQWNSGFCIDADNARTARRSVLETCVEQNAIMLPAHFSAPHAFKVHTLGDKFSLSDAAG